MQVTTEPQEETDLPLTGDYRGEEEAHQSDHDAETTEAAQADEADGIMTPAQSQQYISDVAHEIMSSWEHPSVAEIEVKLRELIVKEISKAQTNLEVINKSMMEQYQKKCDDLNQVWAQKFERHLSTTTQLIEAELNSRDLYWRATVDDYNGVISPLDFCQYSVVHSP